MRKSIAAFASLLFVLTSVRTPAKEKTFHWGVQGHPCLQEAYIHVPIATQLDLLVELGARWYRSDWPADTVVRSPEVYDNLIAEAARRKISILPIIFPTVGCRSPLPPEEIQKESFKFAKSVAQRFRGRITHWELDNELDNYAILQKGDKNRFGEVWESSGHPSGDRPEQFEESRYRKVAAELKGLAEGIKAGDPKAKTMIDVSWLHYGFIERLIKEDKVKFDILALHWYSDMGDVTKVNGKFNLLEHLRTYGKPIWVTEAGWRDDLKTKNGQAEWMRTIPKQFRSLPGVEAFFLYELLDEPYFGPDSSESHFGLVTLVKDAGGKWQVSGKKEGYSVLQTVIQSSRP